MRELRSLFCLALSTLVAASSTLTPPALLAQSPPTEETVTITGEYWALIIGISKYKHMRELATPADDAKAVYDVLTTRYGFKPNRVALLTTPQETTRTAIENVLQRFTTVNGPGPNDSLLIYYAGHGQITQDTTQGYWVPSDGKEQEAGTLINNAVVHVNIRAMKAKHVLLVADTCFAGSLFADFMAGAPIYDTFYGGRYALRSRRALVSGGKEPVSDAGSGGRSVFAYAFLKELESNRKPYLVPSEFATRVAQRVNYESPQKPRYDPLQLTGHDGGEFVFQLANVTPIPGGWEHTSGLVDGEDKPRPPVTSLPPEGMALVPAGEFLMAANATGRVPHSVYLADFYMDKYEVTVSAFDKFRNEATPAPMRPLEWDKADLSKHKNHPIVGVSWFDAKAFCEWIGKRLPTEAEWEKAARGTDARWYPWGAVEPTSKLTNYDKGSCWFCNVYEDRLTEAGRFPEGRSPYGIYDLAGNAAEWVADWYDKDYYRISPGKNPKGPDSGTDKVFRGGSWNTDQVSAVSRGYATPQSQYDDIGFRCAMDAPK